MKGSGGNSLSTLRKTDERHCKNHYQSRLAMSLHGKGHALMQNPGTLSWKLTSRLINFGKPAGAVLHRRVWAARNEAQAARNWLDEDETLPRSKSQLPPTPYSRSCSPPSPLAVSHSL